MSQSPTASGFLGIPRAAAIEIVTVLFIALLIDALFVSGTRFRDISPHPFWLLTLVVAAQYGTASGVLASILGTLLAYAGNLQPRDPLQDQSVYLLAVMAKPVVWFGSAVVLGELRLRQDRKHARLQDRLGELDALNTALAESNIRIEGTVDRLRSTAAGQVATTVALFQAAKDVESHSTTSVFESVGPLIRSILSPTSYSVYLKSGTQLDLVIHVNHDKVPDAAKSYVAGTPLYDAVVGEHRAVHVATEDGQAVLGQDGVLAGPLVDVETGTVVGMLKIEALPMPMLRADSLQAFRGLCEWIGGAYRKAQAFEEANRSRVNVPGSQLFSDAFYQSVTTFLLALAERSRFEVSQLTIRVLMDSKVESIQNQTTVRQTVASVATNGLRTTDLAFDYYEVRGEFLVVLPMTPAANCQVVTERLRQRIVEALRQENLEVQLFVTYETLYVPTPDDVKPWHRPLFRRTAPYGLD